MLRPAVVLLMASVASASIFDFMQGHFQQEASQQHVDYENNVLNADCNKHVCPDTLACVATPQECPCPFPLLQLRCVLPDGEFVCISKPAGKASLQYDDPQTNWKVDAKSDKIRDCGWVNRAYKS